MHININGLIRKIDTLTVCLEELLEGNTLPDVLCVTEHNMIYEDTQFLNLENYNLASCSSRENRRGGSCILIKNIHKFTELNDCTNFSVINHVECCGIELLEHRIVVICIYRAPKLNKQSIDIFFDALNQLLYKYCDQNKKIIICGDFNIDILKVNALSTKFSQLIDSFNLKMQFKEITRPKSGTCIDNILHNIKDSTGKINEFALSDHTAQMLKCPVKKTCILKSWYIFRRDYSFDNLDKFNNYLKSLHFEDVYTNNNANDAYNNFLDSFKMLYDLCFPIIKIKIPAIKRARWITRGIRVCSRRKRELLYAYRIKPCISTKNKYKEYSKRFKKIIKLTQKSKNDYYIKTADNKSKATWKVISKIKSNFPRQDVTAIIDKNGDIVNCPLKMAESFNNFFIEQSSGNLINSKCNMKHATRKNIPNSMFLGPCLSNDIVSCINTLKNSSSTGYDEFSTKVIKYVAPIIAPVLSHIFNLCVDNGLFPDKLKISTIRPVHKKGRRDNMSNYRPIALLSIFSKVFEKIIYNSMSNFLEQNKVFTDSQKGFRKGKTINRAIYDYLSKILINLDKRLPVAALYMDISKAFDHVKHNILLEKLSAYGIRGNILDMIKSYLSNRYQITVINKLCPKSKVIKSYKSKPRKITCGVPQGSVLGPLLFLIYINDLPEITENPVILFADDSTIIFNNSDNNDLCLENNINMTLGRVIDWLQSNNLSINLNKTKIMNFNLIQNYNLNINYNIIYKNTQIKQTNNIKFLGLEIDSNFSWKFHIESVCKKVNKFSYALRLLSKIVSENAVVVAYHGYISSILRYGVIFWGNSSGREMVFKSQKKCIRAIFGLIPAESCRPYFQKNEILTVSSIYIYEAAVFVKSNQDLYKWHEHDGRYSHKNQIIYSTHKTAFYGNSVAFMTQRVFNHLPASISVIDDLQLFKKKLKILLCNKSFYSIEEYFNCKW